MIFSVKFVNISQMKLLKPLSVHEPNQMLKCKLIVKKKKSWDGTFKRYVSISVVVCVYNQIYEVERVSHITLKRHLSVSVFELALG